MKEKIGGLLLFKSMIDDIEESYPWWCITVRMKVNYMIKQSRKERDKYWAENE